MGDVVDMQVQKRLIEEARAARAKRKAERDLDSMAEKAKKCTYGNPDCPKCNPPFPGGIDDMEIG